MPATVAFLLSQRLSPSLSSIADVRTLKDMTLQGAEQYRADHHPGDTTGPGAGEAYGAAAGWQMIGEFMVDAYLRAIVPGCAG
jgi:hypothetical protein